MAGIQTDGMADLASRIARESQRCRAPGALRRLADDWVEFCLAALFDHFGHPECEGLSPLARLRGAVARLEDLLIRAGVNAVRADEAARAFAERLPTLYDDLWEDARAMDAHDPASESVDEVISAYPGFYAVAVYRIAHELAKQQIPLVPRLVAEHAHKITGVDIHPDAVIGVPLVIDHGTGVVVGQTSTIGKGVVLYQGVTLGALAVEKSLAETKRHPTIEDDVVIYAGATILGGDTVVGEGSVIGGNAWVTRSVPPNSVVTHDTQVRPRGVRKPREFVDFGAFI